MLGRGTRLCRDLLPPKSHFTVFDCFDGTLLEYFRKVSAFTIEPPDKPSRTIEEVVEAVWQNRDRAYNVRCLVKRLQRIDKGMSGEAREMFAARAEATKRGFGPDTTRTVQIVSDGATGYHFESLFPQAICTLDVCHVGKAE